MNIYQAALKLRQDFAHTGIELEATTNPDANLYFVFHDALHTYLGARPQESDEPIVLATELVLGGQEWQQVELLKDVNPDEISKGLSNIPSDMLEIYIEFYTNYYSV